MDLGWLVRRWKLTVLLPILAYVLSIPASLIAYAVHDLAMMVAILENALWASLALGIALFALFIALGIARPIRDAPRVGLRHVYLFVVLFIALILALFALVLHAPPTLAEAYFILTTLNFSFSLIGSGLVVAGLMLHNFLTRIKGSVVLRGLLAATIIAPALAITLGIVITMPTPTTAPPPPPSLTAFFAKFTREFTKTALTATTIGLATALPLEAALIIAYIAHMGKRRQKQRR
jgi:ethanolamine utilization microcompartment shell protein EutS